MRQTERDKENEQQILVCAPLRSCSMQAKKTYLCLFEKNCIFPLYEAKGNDKKSVDEDVQQNKKA